MSDVHAVESGSEIVSVPFSPPAEADNTQININEAGRQLSSWRAKQRDPKSEPTPAAPVEAAAEQPESEAQADDAAPPQEATGETQATDPVEQPLELPRSWSKEKEAYWTKLDRETQQYLLEHDSEVSKGVRNAQNEAAEQRKSFETKAQQAEQARQQYEAALPVLLQSLVDVQAGEFADIKSMDDVQRLSVDDPVRYLKWDAQQKKIAAVAQQAHAARERQGQEFRQQWSDFATKQDQLLLDRAPELQDKARASKVADSAMSLLKDNGFTEQELGQLWNGELSLSLRDHRVQLMLLDNVKYREAKTAKPALKPVPQVQRPGVAQPKGRDDAVQASKETFERKADLKSGAAFLAARRRSA